MVQLTTDISIVIQFITGVVGLQGLFFNLSEKHQILKNVLTLEMIVQCIECNTLF